MKQLARWYFNRKLWQRPIIGLLFWPVGILIIVVWLVYMILVMPIAAVETFLEDSRA